MSCTSSGTACTWGGRSTTSDELEQVLGGPVDLVVKRALHNRLRDMVLSEAKVVYAA